MVQSQRKGGGGGRGGKETPGGRKVFLCEKRKKNEKNGPCKKRILSMGKKKGAGLNRSLGQREKAGKGGEKVDTVLTMGHQEENRRKDPKKRFMRTHSLKESPSNQGGEEHQEKKGGKRVQSGSSTKGESPGDRGKAALLVTKKRGGIGGRRGKGEQSLTGRNVLPSAGEGWIRTR